MVVVICEGCDKTGKTTFINEWFSQRKNCIIRHFKQPPSEVVDQSAYQYRAYKQEIAWLKENRSLNVIYDRFLYGEAVYAPLYRSYDPAWVWELEQEIIDSKIEAVLVLFEASNEHIYRKQKQFRDDYMDPEDIMDVVSAFNDVYDRAKLPKTVIYPVHDGLNFSMDHLGHFIYKQGYEWR